ncbi:MAG: hypothetical protein JNL54_19910, partial [Kineosporiaceae bacterium]|nr:hypothetical protein [Kineosporiaceae bacterium]
RGRPWSIPALTRLVEQSKSDSVDVGMARELSRAVQGAGFTRETSRLAGLLRQAGAAARGSGEPPLSPHETAMLAVHHRLAPEWYLDGIDGVSLGAGELLRALAEVWPTLDEAAQGVLAPHAVVAGVQAGMGQIGLLPSHEAVDLVRAATREPVRHLLREAVGPGIQPARGMIIQLLGRPVSAINRDRLGERVADCFTRSVLLEAGNGQGFHHNYLMLPLPVSVQTETGQEDLARVVLGDWLAHLSRREAQDYLAEQIRVVEPHLRGDGQTDWLVRWCEPALPSEEGKRSLRMFRR